jgi:hypothetical protein
MTSIDTCKGSFFRITADMCVLSVQTQVVEGLRKAIENLEHFLKLAIHK